MVRARSPSPRRLTVVALVFALTMTACTDASPAIDPVTPTPSPPAAVDPADVDRADVDRRADERPGAVRAPAAPQLAGERTARRPSTAATGTPATDAGEPATSSPTPTPASQSAASGQIRGAWVHLFDDSLKTTAGIERVVSEARDAGVNTLIVQVVRRHDAYYDSSVLPRTPDPRLQSGLAVLAEVIRRAEPAGIAVEAWIVVGPTYHHAYDGLDQPEGWVHREHGRNAPEVERWVSRAADGSWGYYLDLGLPEVADHVTAVAVEIASNYRVDAVHLDYVRYQGMQWGYHPRALERFRAETGRSETPSASDPQWSDWRRARATALAGAVTRAVHTASPGTQVTAATIAWGEGPRSAAEFRTSRSYREVFQDWPSWVADGTVDRAYPMAYFRASEHAAWFDRWVSFSADVARDGRADVIIGVGAWLNPADVVVDQLRDGTAATDGAIVFSWQQPSDGDRAAALAAIRGLWGG